VSGKLKTIFDEFSEAYFDERSERRQRRLIAKFVEEVEEL
jgi:hypothetical protein